MSPTMQTGHGSAVSVPSAPGATVIAFPVQAVTRPNGPAPAANDDTVGPAPSRRSWLQAMAERVMSAMRAWRDRQVLRDALLSMDRHQLADIGLTREDISAVVHGRFHRPPNGA